MRLCESCVQSCPALGEASRHWCCHFSRIEVPPNVRSCCIACPNNRYETLAKMTGGGALFGKWAWERTAKSMQGDPLLPHPEMRVLSGMVQLRTRLIWY